MKLAEALLLRADMNVELGRLGRRLARNARVEKGSVPGEDPLVLLEEALRVVREREALMIRINITKMQTRLPNGMSLMAALARRSRLESERTLVLETIGKAEVAKSTRPPRISTRARHGHGRDVDSVRCRRPASVTRAPSTIISALTIRGK